jgi:hypothetical protein
LNCGLPVQEFSTFGLGETVLNPSAVFGEPLLVLMEHFDSSLNEFVRGFGRDRAARRAEPALPTRVVAEWSFLYRTPKRMQFQLLIQK